jgi:hypothetical protein
VNGKGERVHGVFLSTDDNSIEGRLLSSMNCYVELSTKLLSTEDLS